jgi:uncharacterized membrane protein (UPF0127 family)
MQAARSRLAAPRHLPFVLGHLSLLLLMACSPSSAQTSTPSTAPATVTIKNKPFQLELALTEDQHQRGLMYRASMPADHGMLFVFDKPDTYSFWMHNTLIPLDIIFLDPSGKVVDIHTRQSKDDTGIPPRDPALYVIELNAGTAKSLGLTVGDTIELPASITHKDLKPAPHPNDK